MAHNRMYLTAKMFVDVYLDEDDLTDDPDSVTKVPTKIQVSRTITMRPAMVSITYAYGQRYGRPEVRVYGNRILKSGKLGAETAHPFYGYNRAPWIEHLIQEYQPEWDAIISWEDGISWKDGDGR